MSATQRDQVIDYRSIYDVVTRFYDACRGESNLSDTWVHSLKRKGSRYSFDEMLKMRRPGSFVTLHINVFDYFLDPTRVDESNAIVAALLARGESGVGEPLQDVPLAGKRFSSVYLKHLDIAAGIIAHLNTKGIERPTLLEIGGGQGLLLAALRSWYGDRLTVIAADIPETLLYQSYFLLATFPEAAFGFRPTAAAVPVAVGGFNFVNAYVLAEQDYDIDVAINANSMQEMSGGVANAYLAYIDKVIRPNGTLFFRNSFGHAVDSVPEPSEYAFGPRWRLVAADYGDFFTDSSATEFAAFVFDRTATPQDEERRRLQLRILWNGFAAGRLVPGGETTRRLVQSESPPAASLPWAPMLADAIRLPEPVCADPAPPVDLAGADARWRRATAIRTFQKRLAAEMDAVRERPPAATRTAVDAAAAAFIEDARASGIGASDFWTGYAAAMLVGLGRGAAAVPLIEARERTDDVYWRLRFAWLFARAGLRDKAAAALAGVSRRDLDVFWWPMAAAVASSVGDAAAAAAWLDRAEPMAAAQGTDELRLCLFRTNLAIGRIEAAVRQFDALTDANEARQAGTRLGMVAALLRAGETSAARELLRRIRPEPASSPTLAEILWRLGDREPGEAMARRIVRENWDSYYALGGIARTLFAIGQGGEAEAAMARSAELRPGATRHLDYLANLAFDAGRLDLAARWFSAFLATKPYDDIFRGRHAYARLPAAVRETGVFGAPADQALIFQSYQSFYYPQGPQIR